MNRSTVWRAYSPSRDMGGPARTDRALAVGDASQRNLSASTYRGVEDWTVEEGVVKWNGRGEL